MGNRVEREAVLANTIRITLTRDELAKIMTDMAQHVPDDKIMLDIRVFRSEQQEAPRASISFNGSFGTQLDDVEQYVRIEWEDS